MPKILIVEDDPISLAYLESQLRMIGHETVSFQDAESAWKSITADGQQIVISDWNLPGLSGIDLCRRIRAGGMREYVFFFLITSHQGEGKLAEAMEAGVDDFLVKPIDAETLAVRLRVSLRILNFHRQIRTLQDLLPICMYCKKIRNDKAFWVNVETYFSTHAGADFTHSLCPDCFQDHVKPEFDALRNSEPKQ